MSTLPPRTLVIHHDDLGGSHAANMAFVELCDAGIATAGSVMVPCPWFPEIAAIARARPELSVGVHLTLTAEWQYFRWRPLTGIAANGLTDPGGYFWRSVNEARGAAVAAVEAELRAQVLSALDAGIDVTHLDSHMGTIWQPEFVDIYARLGEEFRLPIVLTRDVGRMAPAGFDYGPICDRLAARGNPDFQRYLTTPFGNLAPTADDYTKIFDRAVPGLNWCAMHFTGPGDFAQMSDDAPLRLAEYNLFKSGWARDYLADQGFELVGMRAFRDAMRAAG